MEYENIEDCRVELGVANIAYHIKLFQALPYDSFDDLLPPEMNVKERF